MARLPKSVQALIEAWERLPGIGPKTAVRMTFYLLHVPQAEIDKFAAALTNLKKATVVCSVCFNISEEDPCFICSDTGRDKTQVCIVEQPLDVISIENAGNFHGTYHILNGVIDPLNNIGPDELTINKLLKRIKENQIKEIILATNPSMEGEATAMYIRNEISRLRSDFAKATTDKQDFGGQAKLKELKITRLAHGLPMGADIEFSDGITLSRAIEGRREY